MALTFSGAQYISLPANDLLKVQTFSIAGLITTGSNVNTTQYIMSTADSTQGYGNPFSLYISNGRLVLKVGYMGVILFFFNVVMYDTLTGNTTLKANTSYNIAATYDGSTMKLYLNGILDGTLASSRTLLNGTISGCISGLQAGSTTYQSPLSGTISAIRLYDRVLSPNECETIAHLSGRDLIHYGLIGRWILNEGAPGISAQGTRIIKDLGPNKMDLTTTGNPKFSQGGTSFTRPY